MEKKDTLGKQEEIWPSAEEKAGLFDLQIPNSSSHLNLFDLFACQLKNILSQIIPDAKFLFFYILLGV